MKKNIWKSILITNFVVMILVSAYLYISQSLEMYYLEKEDSDTKAMYIDSAKSFEDSFVEKAGDEKLYEEGKFLRAMMYRAHQSIIEIETYAMIVSIIIGIGIGYIVTVTTSFQDKKTVTKKIAVTYISGAILISALCILFTKLTNSSFYILGEVISLISVWTIVFVATLLIKRFSDNKKAKELKDALDSTRK